jgi:hypothetical protein
MVGVNSFICPFGGFILHFKSRKSMSRIDSCIGIDDSRVDTGLTQG